MTPLAAQQIPHMDRCQGSTQLIVSGRPFIIFGGELGNFAAGTAAQADDILPRVARAWIQASARKALHDPKTVMRTYVPKKNTLAVASVSASFAWDLNRQDRTGFSCDVFSLRSRSHFFALIPTFIYSPADESQHNQMPLALPDPQLPQFQLHLLCPALY